MIYNAQAISNNDVRLSINKTYIYIYILFIFLSQFSLLCFRGKINVVTVTSLVTDLTALKEEFIACLSKVYNPQ